MKKHLFALLFTTLLCSQIGYSQVVLQSFPFLPASNGTFANGVALDGLNNVFVAGAFMEPSNLFDVTGILRKFDETGNLIWIGERVILPVGSSWAWAEKVSTDAQGNSYVFGSFAQDMQLVGGSVLTGFGSVPNLFLAKYNAQGILQWSKIIGGPNTDFNWIYGIECDAAGNFIITGRTKGTQFSFGNNIDMAVTHPLGNCFVAKFSGSGDALWAQPVSWGSLKGLVVTPSGEMLISGTSDFTVDIAIGNTAYGWPGSYLAKLSSSGVPIWVKIGEGYANALGTDAAGAIYLAGDYSAGVSFDGISIPTQSPYTSGCIFKYDSSGTFIWAKAFPSNNYQGVEIRDVKGDSQGNCLFAATYRDSLSIDSNVFTTLAGDYDMLFCKLDQQGSYLWSLEGRNPGLYSFDQTPYRFVLDTQDNCYLAGTTGLITEDTVTFGNFTSTEGNSFLYKLTTNSASNIVSGRVFYDFNANGIKDGNDTLANNLLTYTQPNSTYQNLLQNSWYYSLVNPGNYTITLPNPPLHYTVVPGSHTGTITTSGVSDSTLHFALQPIPNQQDLRITATALTPSRPGFAFPLRLTYKNIGTVAMSGTIELPLDSMLLFQNSVPTPDSVAGNTLTWSFTNLQPMESATILVNTTVSAAATLGSYISSPAQIFPVVADLVPADNISTVRSLITGSFDPNDKQVSDSILTPAEVVAGKYLEYTIRFQNTGTDTAFTVRLIDTLDTQLNIATFGMLASSHNYTWSIRANGILEWQFNNILLPDSNTNEAASHGFVKYRIRPNTNLALGSIIHNTAAIYFDFNAPVITNTATTEVALVSAVADLNKPQLQVYPNPNKGAFTIQLQNVPEQNVKAELRNVLGQMVWQQNLTSENGTVQQQIKTNHLSKGIYYLQVSTGKGTAVQKVVVE